MIADRKLWIKEQCKRMIDDPLHNHFFGQMNQDWFLYMNLYRHKKKGFYVDVGSNHYYRYSNTFFFDYCLGWEGVCVEPNPSYYEGYRNYRTCKAVQSCVFNRTEIVKMEVGKTSYWGARGHIVGHGSQINKSKMKKKSKIIEVGCRTLDDILSEHVGNRHIDFLDIDIASQEINTMASLHFRNHSIGLITIEEDHISHRQLQPIMQRGGFFQSPMFQVGGDSIWQNRSLIKEGVNWLRPKFGIYKD